MIKKLFTDLLGISTTQQAVVTTSTGVLGAVLTYSFGGWSELLGFFLFAMAVDYVTGIGASIKEQKGLSSKVGFLGIFKKFLMAVVVAMAHRMDILLGSNVIMTGAIYFYLANEMISITENYGRLGLPLPTQVKQIIQVLKSKGDGTTPDKDVQ
ncbi:phage holin family protein [Paenibacillus frigoriresistens]|uniref:phage holin family protein n=1 Tax=Paenibacillus alginolyticus TaxID=59839 RepID=UPI001562F484|nr:phage holin family protein [Paenibacillus frigoriresistens]NRF91515.1 phage holin family protein [Paenibacillus frigoriresistens]